MFRLPRIADLFTSANLVGGMLAIVLAAQDNPTAACLCVLASAIFDILDGLAARLQGGGSALGAQLDSLADLVSFGVAPAIMVYFQSSQSNWIDGEPAYSLLASVAIIVLASAWRLAKFNVDARQTSGFLGLPTPSNALFWVSLIAIANGIGVPANSADMAISLQKNVFDSQLFLLIISSLMGILMLIEIPLPSLKFTQIGWRGNEVRFVLLILGGSLLIILRSLAVPLILLLYLMSPLWGRIFSEQT